MLVYRESKVRDAVRHWSLLRREIDAALKAATGHGLPPGYHPELAPEEVYWRLHFSLGMIHNNRFAEFDRLHTLSDGATRESDTQGLLGRMLDFAEAGFLA